MTSTIRFAALAAIIALPGLGRADQLTVEAEDAGDHHVSAQGHYRGGLPDSWEWELGSGKSGNNITGIAAQGLLAIHRLTGLGEHEDAAVRAGRSLLKAYDQGWKKRRPYSQDIEFLAAVGFIVDAGRWFQVTTGRYPAPTYADMVIEGRKRARIPQIAGWDLASAVRAAVAVGQVDYARALLAEVVRRRAEWDQAGVGQDLARGSLLWAMAEMRQRAGLTAGQQRLAASLAADLAAAQQPSGAWLERPGARVICTQTTAYAILGLSRWARGKQAAARGRAWLTRSALTDKRYFQGGRMWATTYLNRSGQPENNFNSEIQSEAMMALATGR
jgi:hypothetical protein